jgi:RNA polymerase primary sigma factor
MAKQSAARKTTNQFYEGDLLKRYFKEIANIPLLTREDEVKLAKRIRRGDEEALNTLVESNLRFVVKVASKYRNNGISFLDLINEGNLGLIQAARKFDHTKGVKFITYAIWWIQQSIKQALAKQSLSVRLPLRQVDVFSKIKQRNSELTQKLSREPSQGDIAKSLDVALEDVECILRATNGPVSLNDSLSDDGTTNYMDMLVAENTPSADNGIEVADLKNTVNALVKELNTREGKVIRMRFGLDGGEPLTLQEIASELNLSKERIRQIEKRAKNILRKRATHKNLVDLLN